MTETIDALEAGVIGLEALEILLEKLDRQYGSMPQLDVLDRTKKQS